MLPSLCLSPPAGAQCDSIPLRSEVPSTSVPNWLALLTGSPPAMHGVLGSVAPPADLSLDSVVAMATAAGLHVGVVGSPLFVSPLKAHMPPFHSDGRVSSSADGRYETTAHFSTRDLDAARVAALLGAAAASSRSANRFCRLPGGR